MRLDPQQERLVQACKSPTASQAAGLRVQAPLIFDEMRYRAVIAKTADGIWSRSTSRVAQSATP